MTFINSGSDEFAVFGNYPHELDRYRVPGSRALTYENRDGRIVSQELESTACTIYHTVCRMERNCRLQVRSDTPLLFIWMALQQDQRPAITSREAIFLREGQYNLFYAPGPTLSIPCEGKKEYISLILNYQPYTLQEMHPYFPGLAGFMEDMKSGRPGFLQEESPWVTREIQDTVYRLLHFSLDIVSYPIYFELLAKTLLFHLLLQSVEKRPPSQYSHSEIDGIYAARNMIRKDIRNHFAIREIAQKIGMNEFKLKNGFREIFGHGVYEYLRTERMGEAKQLLSEPGRSIKEVASLTGYKSVNSFIKAFKKKYLQTPGEFRKGV